jgi:DNA modification methylase
MSDVPKPKPEPHLPLPLGTALVLKADSRELPFADDTVDLIVTSPPYFALRSYQDGGEHYDGQIGDEPTPAEFVASLLEVTRECMRVLKPSGSLWVNLGDKYAGKGGGIQGESSQRVGRSNGIEQIKPGKVTGARDKSLIGIPWRYALACIDELGLILRAEVVWSKPNGLPESVTDRVRRSHEQWFHFTLNPRYFSAVDEIREPHVTHDALTRIRTSDYDGPMSGAMNGAGNPLGKLPGSVWTVPTESLRVPDHLGIDHFAAFPTEWPKRIIMGWAPLAGVCTECGEGRRPVKATDHETGYACACTPRTSHRGKRGDWREGREVNESQRAGESDTEGPLVARRPGGFGTKVPKSQGEWEYHFDQWEPAPTTRPVILDPFGGTGTTALVAKALGCDGVSVDMSSDYTRLAEWRTNDREQLSKVQCRHVYGVPKPTKKAIREREQALAQASDTTTDPGVGTPASVAEPNDPMAEGPAPSTVKEPS